MAIGRPMPPLILDDVERETLERWVRRPKTAQALALRARMILGCAPRTTVGTDLGVSRRWKWRSRPERLDGLSDEPRSGRPRAVTERRGACDYADAGPRPGTRPITRSMAQRSSTTRSAALAGLRIAAPPHGDLQGRTPSPGTWWGYTNPPRALVLCVDAPGVGSHHPCARDKWNRTHDYLRHGTTSLFAALEPVYNLFS